MSGEKPGCIFKKGTRIMLFFLEGHATLVCYDPTGGFKHKAYPWKEREINFNNFSSSLVIQDEKTAASIATLLAGLHGLSADASPDVQGGYLQKEDDASRRYNFYSFVLG